MKQRTDNEKSSLKALEYIYEGENEEWQQPIMIQGTMSNAGKVF